MDSRFILPVIVSTAFHALVFWGGSGSHPTTTVTPPPTIERPRDTRMVVEIDPPPVVIEEDTPRLPKGEPQPWTPQGDEPPLKPAIDPVPLAPMLPHSAERAIRIPSGPIGLPEGIEGVTSYPVVDRGVLDNPPRTRLQVKPAYPAEARSSGLTGEVLVAFEVDESGRVSHLRVLSSTDSRFEPATLRAVERWRFEPGTKEGRPVRFRMAVPVVFNLAL